MNLKSEYSIPACPFCGSEDVGHSYYPSGAVAIRCGACEAMGPIANGDDEAASLWKARVGTAVAAAVGDICLNK